MHNPLARWRVTGTWEDHAGYSEGGTDYPTPYGSQLEAPASGTLVFDGWIGSAGRRATLWLDQPVSRVRPASPTLMRPSMTREAAGPMVAIVFQHLSADPRPGHYAEWIPDMVRTGASAYAREFGGDIHCHIHGTDARGYRLDLTKFIGASLASVGAISIPEEDDMLDIITVEGKKFLTTATSMTWIEGPAHSGALEKWVGGATSLSEAERGIVAYYQGKLRGVPDARILSVPGDPRSRYLSVGGELHWIQGPADMPVLEKFVSGATSFTPAERDVLNRYLG